jgi:hypothetical protein
MSDRYRFLFIIAIVDGVKQKKEWVAILLKSTVPFKVFILVTQLFKKTVPILLLLELRIFLWQDIHQLITILYFINYIKDNTVS